MPLLFRFKHRRLHRELVIYEVGVLFPDDRYLRLINDNFDFGLENYFSRTDRVIINTHAIEQSERLFLEIVSRSDPYQYSYSVTSYVAWENFIFSLLHGGAWMLLEDSTEKGSQFRVNWLREGF